jgi:hypothetical protein
MIMKTNVSMYDFERAFAECRPDSFSYEGLKAMFEWFEQLEDDMGEEIELDVIAICCEYTEYENLAEFQDNYGSEDYPDMESIQESTMVIQSDHYVPVGEVSDRSFIIQDF